MSSDTGTRVGHCKADETDIYGGRYRKNGTVCHFENTEVGDRGWLGNPYVLPGEACAGDPEVTVVADRETAVRRFATDFVAYVAQNPEFRAALYERVQGCILGGWCQHLEDAGPRCHLEVVADVADAIRLASETDSA